MSKGFSTAIAGSALLVVGSALAQEPGQSQTQGPQTQEQMDRSSTGATSRTEAQGDQSRNKPGNASNQRAGAADSDAQSQSGKSQTGQSQSTRLARADAAAPAMMLLVVPVSMERKADSTLANGCWAKLYDDYNYGGDSFTVVGPVDLPQMVGPFGIDWDDKVSSIKTGPKANVTIYDNENYRDRAEEIEPAQEIPQLTEAMGLFEEPNSMRINCVGTNG